MSKFVDFCSIPIGQFFITEETRYNPDDQHPHVIFQKVDRSAYQKGMRYPEENKIIMPREDTRPMIMHRDRTPVRPFDIPTTYRLLRSN